MALFRVSLRRDSVSLLRFSFLCHVPAFHCAISLICRLIYPYTCFSSHFSYLVFVVLFVLILSGMLLAMVISSSLFFFMLSPCPHISATMLAIPLLPSFLYIYSLSISSLGCKAFCIIINFLVLVD